jgi:hypothetical protein
MNPSGRRIVRSLAVLATAAAVAMPASAGAASRSGGHNPTVKAQDGKAKRPAGKGGGRRIR